MKLPNFKRLNKNDFPKAMQEAMEKLGFLLNASIELLYTTLDRRVDLANNILCDVINLTVSVDSNGIPVGNSTFTINNPNMLSLQGLTVIRAVNLTNSTVYPSSGIFISFKNINNTAASATITVSVNHITGLQAGNQYQLTLIAWG